MKAMIIIWISFFASEHKVDPLLVEAIILTESAYRPDAVGPIGEIGLMQMRYELLDEPEMYKDPYLNIKEGVKRLAELKRLKKHLGPFWFTAWNAGPSGALRFHKKYGISNHEYAKKVLNNYMKVKKEEATRPAKLRYNYLVMNRDKVPHRTYEKRPASFKSAQLIVKAE